jgi:hypothetical protein
MHAFEATSKLANAANKVTVFDALHEAKITLVEMEFDGEGDSGGITDIYFYVGDTRADPPPVKVTLQIVGYFEAQSVERECSLTDAVETLGLGYLDQEGRAGWENNEGAYGRFRFDVAKRLVEVEFNARFCDIATFSFEF